MLNWNGKDLPAELRELPAGRGDAPEPGTDAWTEWGEVAEDLLRWLI